MWRRRLDRDTGRVPARNQDTGVEPWFRIWSLESTSRLIYLNLSRSDVGAHNLGSAMTASCFYQHCFIHKPEVDVINQLHRDSSFMSAILTSETMCPLSPATEGSCGASSLVLDSTPNLPRMLQPGTHYMPWVRVLGWLSKVCGLDQLLPVRSNVPPVGCCKTQLQHLSIFHGYPSRLRITVRGHTICYVNMHANKLRQERRISRRCSRTHWSAHD